MVEAVQSAFSGIASDAMGVLAVVLPIGLGIFALPFGIRIAKRIFRSAI